MVFQLKKLYAALRLWAQGDKIAQYAPKDHKNSYQNPSTSKPKHQSFYAE